ncbi:putative N-acetyltransferase camello isoform 1-T3 [Discoglossus pictus]
MTRFSIRKYKHSDHDPVRLLFAQGMYEHLPATSFYILKVPQVHITLLVVFIILLVISRSYLLSIISLAVLLAAGWHVLKSEFHQYVTQCYREDLLDIEKSYMECDRSCFWVAESNGKIVGMVGIQPVTDSNDEMVLRRMSVAKDHRGQGIAKALCLMVIDFAHQHKCKVVSLQTSMVQYDAQKLYERVGFKKIHVEILPTFFGRFTNYSILSYAYNINA